LGAAEQEGVDQGGGVRGISLKGNSRVIICPSEPETDEHKIKKQITPEFVDDFSAILGGNGEPRR
jgi:hypothetical protein